MTRCLIFKSVMYTISEGVWVFKRVPHRDWSYFLLYQTINVQILRATGLQTNEPLTYIYRSMYSFKAI